MNSSGYGAIFTVITLVSFGLFLIGIIAVIYGFGVGVSFAATGGIALCIFGLLMLGIARIIELLTDIRNNLKQ